MRTSVASRATPPWGSRCSYGADRRTMAYLWLHRHFEPEYYCGIIGVYSEEQQLARKISDTLGHPYLLVRKDWLRPPDVCRRHLDITGNRSSMMRGCGAGGKVLRPTWR